MKQYYEARDELVQSLWRVGEASLVEQRKMAGCRSVGSTPLYVEPLGPFYSH